MNELLALLGLAWPRLLLYPGGLCAILLAWLWGWATDDGQPRTKNRDPRTNDQEAQASLVTVSPCLRVALSPCLRVSRLAVVPPLLLISLLPLPLSAQLMRSIDLLVAVALLEWPVVMALVVDNPGRREQRIERLRLGYGVLLPALLLFGQASHSFTLDALVARPGQIELLPLLLRISAIGGWAIALVPLLGLGPFQEREANGDIGQGAESMRAVGHILVATLPLLALWDDHQWLAPFPPLALGGMLIAAHRRIPITMPVWKRVLQAMTALLWALLAWASFAALLARTS